MVFLLKPNWTFDFISVELDNKSPNIANIEVEITKPRRGVSALSGSLELKEDITDELHVELATFYSPTGSNFNRTPFAIPEANLSTIMNNYYKEYIMDSIQNCSENTPRIEDEFVAPLRKCAMHLTDCVISNENMPTMLRIGYYKLVFRVLKLAKASVEFLVKVEQK